MCGILGLINPGDAVLIENPTYSLYADAIRLAGGVVENFGRRARPAGVGRGMKAQAARHLAHHLYDTDPSTVRPLP
ncbi:hypothetical protein CAL29_10295 [Bordetella genomosp. 10]|uniref:Aminotransferase class I/classII large domain-containing protein n=1 Tax=Bordetella genomosp. 10 TaxID=1416804 RepID=A0A261S985_9BORD|nr:hypothetical protein CAL29_10295 [Bordetella genomosp. 10]